MPNYRPEYSDEAWTLDYLSPHWGPWYEDGEVAEFATQEEAETFKSARKAECSDTFRCYRVREVPTPEEAATAYEARCREEARFKAETPAKGKTVTVVKGRKIPVGTTGECFWYGEGKVYGYASRYSRPPMRVGFKDAAGETYWTDASNVDVVDPAQYLPVEYREEVAA